MNALISASRLPSLHSRGFPCCGIETGSRQGKTGDHTNIRRREKVGIGLSPKIVSIFAQSGGWNIRYQCVLHESDFVSKFAKKSDLDLWSNLHNATRIYAICISTFMTHQFYAWRYPWKDMLWSPIHLFAYLYCSVGIRKRYAISLISMYFCIFVLYSLISMHTKSF